MDCNQIKEAYDASALTYAEICFNELSYKPLDRQLLDRFAELIGNSGKILDIGCGPGQTSIYLHSRGADVIGADLSDKMINEAKKLNPHIEFCVEDMFHLKRKNEEFTGICAFYAIVNFQYPDIDKIFKEFFRVLKKNGLLILGFHVEEKEIKVDNFFESGKSLDFYYFDETKIISILEKAGFEIAEALIRFPYREEYPSKRAYIIAKRK